MAFCLTKTNRISFIHHPMWIIPANIFKSDQRYSLHKPTLLYLNVKKKEMQACIFFKPPAVAMH